MWNRVIKWHVIHIDYNYLQTLTMSMTNGIICFSSFLPKGGFRVRPNRNIKLIDGMTLLFRTCAWLFCSCMNRFRFVKVIFLLKTVEDLLENTWGSFVTGIVFWEIQEMYLVRHKSSIAVMDIRLLGQMTFLWQSRRKKHV